MFIISSKFVIIWVVTKGEGVKANGDKGRGGSKLGGRPVAYFLMALKLTKIAYFCSVEGKIDFENLLAFKMRTENPSTRTRYFSFTYFQII